MPGRARIGSGRFVGLLVLLSVGPSPAEAERLPATIYTTSQGLPHNRVSRVVADSRGFIWFATREGLSRYDGYAFTNYGVDDGLPSAAVNDVLETRDGVYLVATDGGLARLENIPRRTGMPPARLFTVEEISSDPRTRLVTTLYQSRDGKVWIGTHGGLFLAEADGGGGVRYREVETGWESRGPSDQIWSLAEDRFGAVWIATSRSLHRLWPDGRFEVHFPDFGGGMHSVLSDRMGHVWAGTRLSGLLELTFDQTTGRLAGTRAHTTSNGLPHNWINQLFEASDGELWAASPAGLILLTRTASNRRQIRLFSESHGLGRGGFQAVTRDRNGNLWAATLAGAVKIAPSGFSAFGASDGIGWGISLMQTRSGRLCFVGPGDDRWGLHCFNGLTFDFIRPRFRQGTGALSWGWNQTALEDHTGDWWFATREGVARFVNTGRPHDLHGRSPDVWYGTRDGLAAAVTLRLFEDSRADVWIASVGEGGRNGLARWQRATGTLQRYSTEPNLPDLSAHFPTSFAEDRSGSVWIGFSGEGGAVRYRSGTFERFNAAGVFRGAVRNIFRDSSDRLWFASYHGLIRVDDAAAVSPSFRVYTTRDGLSSNEATAVAEDLQGRLYVGTGRGVDRLDPATGRIRHFSARDGFTSGEIHSALLDRRTGHLWFAQESGVSRLIPPPDPPLLPPPILFTRVEVAAQPEALGALGQPSLPDLSVEPHRNHLRFEYVALGFGPGEDLRYQYRLQGAPNDWSVPSTQRSVNFANLAPGAYRFEVRAVSADGVPSPQPASVEFTILPPIWQRAWFIALVAAAAASLLYTVYRYRLARAMEIASMRTRIATDLHDDIGANLTKIAILTEVTRRHLDDGEAADRLSAIARISRESVASMSDVVWAINPKRDTWRDTIRRMRQHAEEVFAGSGVALEFAAADGDQKLRLSSEIRRDFFLIFKEALNNAVRHSRCRKVRVDVHADDSGVHFRLSDDGRGFETADDHAGNGLMSMHRRARKMGAKLDVVSAAGQGTTVSLSVPGPHAGRPLSPA
jgi:signal transduction histidine kinase/ligand-binding sensor domain-containing protein